MSVDQVRIFPLGDSALTVEFGNSISTALNEQAIALSNHFENHPFPGFIESVPAYASTTIFYDPLSVKRQFPDFPTAFETVKSLAANAIGQLNTSKSKDGPPIEIPMFTDAESALDLELVAQNTGLGRDAVIDIFTATTYRVFMLGFLPGFTYMGEVDERIAMTRKVSPRLKTPKGSIGIAGKQTGIYSLESPGGWQIIGRTEVEMFLPNAEHPSYLQPGDMVRFVSVK